MNLRAAVTFSASCALSIACLAADDHEVSGYFRKDGTYVAPHMQTNPNNTLMDNYSTRGNVNPYTGKAGTVDPYSVPALRYEAPPAYVSPTLPRYVPPPQPVYQPALPAYAPSPTYRFQPIAPVVQPVRPWGAQVGQ